MKQAFYRKQALYYTNLCIQKKFRSSIHLEDKEDLLFWGPVFKAYFPKERFYLITHSKSHSNQETSGCKQCLAYRNYLNKHFLICVDSDYHYLHQEKDFDIKHFIFQTYTYSFENHLCVSRGLKKIVEECCNLENTVFDFEAFFSSYSALLYELFIWYLFLQKEAPGFFSQKEFLALITLPELSSIDQNGAQFLTEIKEKAEKKTDSLKTLFPDKNIETTKALMRSLGVTETNAYLYIRGHHVFSLCNKVGKLVCNHLLKQEKQRLENNNEAIKALYDQTKPFDLEIFNNILWNSYPEINKIAADMNLYKRIIFKS